MVWGRWVVGLILYGSRVARPVQSLAPSHSYTTCADGFCVPWTNQATRYDFDNQCFGQCMPNLLLNYNCTKQKAMDGHGCFGSGACQDDGTCVCDSWTRGPDCSFLRFEPVNKTRQAFPMNQPFSTWGGNVLYDASHRTWHLYNTLVVDQIQGIRGYWSTKSAVAHSESDHPEGPYTKLGNVMDYPNHNPTARLLHNNSVVLYSITKGSSSNIAVAMSRTFDGPFDESVARDLMKGETSSGTYRTNPGPFIQTTVNKAEHLTMYYRSDNIQWWKRLPRKKRKRICSTESIAMAQCDTLFGPCTDLNRSILGHTAEDPSVFKDSAGIWHMLMNAYPGHCNPKTGQGGHAWSKDGVHWSTVRAGAFNTTVHFTDGTSMKCNRRERPQMVLDPTTSAPLVLVTGMLCDNVPNRWWGGSDTVTLIQPMHLIPPTPAPTPALGSASSNTSSISNALSGSAIAGMHIAVVAAASSALIGALVWAGFRRPTRAPTVAARVELAPLLLV